MSKERDAEAFSSSEDAIDTMTEHRSGADGCPAAASEAQMEVNEPAGAGASAAILPAQEGAAGEEAQGAVDDMSPARPMPSWYYWIFAASGFAGLIYESIWARYLKLLLGHAAYAQALVLAIFLFGLAAGAALCARFSQRVHRPLLWYAAIEVMVALMAIYFHEIFVSVQNWAIGFVLPQVESDQTAELIKWGLATMLILPQSILLGATFPLMSAGLVRLWPDMRGRLVAMLYFSNSLGAVFGVLASGFLLIPFIGLPVTIAVAGLINTAAATAVWVLGHRFDDTAPALMADTAKAPAFGRTPLGADTRLTMLITIVSFGTGLASFIYEIVWVRMLSLLLGSSTHTFEIMLAAFILGLALGGAAVYRRVDSTGTEILTLLGKVQIAMGALALWSLFSFSLIYDILNEVLRVIPRNDNGYLGYNIIGLGLALLMMLPATFCAGMTLPLLTRRLIDSGGESAIGRVYAANTLGAIAGVFIAVHLLLPLAGLQQALLAGASVDLLLGVGLLGFVSRFRVAMAFSFSVVLLAVAAWGGKINTQIASAGVYRDQSDKLLEVVFYRDGKTASISVTKGHLKDSPISTRHIRTNGKADASLVFGGNAAEHGYTPDEMTMVMSGLMPLLYKPDAKRVMNIGFGSGLTSRTLLLSRNLQQLDNVEIEPMIIEGAKMLGERTAPVFSDPRNRFIVNDAKSVLARAPLLYDVIISEPSNPWVSGVANLFTKEFYQQVRRALADDGIFVQWINLYESNPSLVASAAQALDEVFADYDAYLSSTGDLIFIASADDALPEKLNAIFASDEARAFFSGYDFRSAEDTNALLIGNREILKPYFESFLAPVNSDYYPYIETHAAAAFFKKYFYTLGEISHLPVPVLDFLGYHRLYSDVLPGRHSSVMQHVSDVYQLYESRLTAGGRFQSTLQRLSEKTCPVQIENPLRQAIQDAHTADEDSLSKEETDPIISNGSDNTANEAATAYMLDVSGLISQFMPHATKKQMNEVWRLLEKNQCIRALLENDRNTAALYTQFWKALSLRQGEQLILLTDQLLRFSDINTPSGQILFLASMAANYQSRNYQQVVSQMFDLPGRAAPAVRHAARLIAANAAQKI